jgi:hypothetical protein
MKKRERNHPLRRTSLPLPLFVRSGNYRDGRRERNMSGRYRQVFIAGNAGPFCSELRSVRASASPAQELAPEHGDRPLSKNAATVIGGSSGKGRSIRVGCRSTKKKLDRDDPRAADRMSFSILSALSVTAALRPPLLLAACRLTVASPRFPLPPPARSLSARFTAIACQRMLGPVNALAALQQTDSAPGTMGSTLTPLGSKRSAGILIFGRS